MVESLNFLLNPSVSSRFHIVFEKLCLLVGWGKSYGFRKWKYSENVLGTIGIPVWSKEFAVLSCREKLPH